ncbi:MAG: hypothetical protein KJO77_01940, partial [Bacteroidia bacterium]|nr:hypothetical protein [Bacteroidia bacterium]
LGPIPWLVHGINPVSFKGSKGFTSLQALHRAHFLAQRRNESRQRIKWIINIVGYPDYMHYKQNDSRVV